MDSHANNLWSYIQIGLTVELEERLPSVRHYFFKKFHLVTRPQGGMSQLPFLLIGDKFDDKVKAVKDSEGEGISNVIEKYQVHT